MRQKFDDDLQNTLDKLPQADILIFLDDFNARVGKRDSTNDQCQGTLGIHGLGERNAAGEEFLEFCAMNHLTIMNSWLEKKEIHLGTWSHPATKRHHMIDYVVMCASQRMFCIDAQVMRGVNCWSDHRMVRAKLLVKASHSQPKKRSVSVPFAIHQLCITAQMDAYREYLTQQLQEVPHNPESSAEHNWNTLKNRIIAAAEHTIGHAKKNQPDWFLESADILTPLIVAKNQAHNRMLQSKSIAHRKEFRRHQRKVKTAIENAKEEWIRKTALEAEKAVKDGCTR